MKQPLSQRGVTLVELAFVIVIASFIIVSALYGTQVIRSTKVKAYVIQLNHIKNAGEMFRRQYGTWPGDFGQATNRLNGCNAASACENGNGDQIVASSNSNGCRMPDYQVGDQAFPCTNVTGGNETAQYWRHLVLSGLIENITLRMDGSGNPRYRWGDSMPKVRLGGGFQILYNGNRSNLYVENATGHFLVYQRNPRQFHRNFNANGDGAMTSYDARAIDIEMDDGVPGTGNFRSRGGWGCHDDDGNYTNYGQMDCSTFYKISD